jgi:hypothetical protein
VTLILGLCRALYPVNIMLFHASIFALAIIMNRRRPSAFGAPKANFILEHKFLLFSLAVFFGFFLVKAWLNLLNPPVCPESHQYHLSFPATWIRNGNIQNPLVVFGPKDYPENFTALTYYPMSAEFYYHWLTVYLRNAFLADAGQVPFYFLGILAIYSILRKFALKKEVALFSGLLWALVPNLFKQVKNGAQVDVMAAAMFLVVLNYILLLKERPRLRNFIPLGISLGVFVSIKAINIFWSLAMLPLFAYIFFANKIKKRFSAIGLVLFFILLIGGYSYINNYILTKNIFYPITFKLFGKTIMGGTIDKETFAYLLYPWEQFRIRDVLFSEGLGGQLLLFILPGAFIPLFLAPLLRKKYFSPGFMVYFLLFLIPLIMLVEYFFYIKAFWIRYFFPFLGMGLVCFAVFLDKFKWGRYYIIVLGTLCVIASAAELAKRGELIASLILSIFLFFALSKFAAPLIKSKKLASRRTSFGAVAVLAVALVFLNAKYNREEAQRYPLLFQGKEAGEKEVGLAWQWVHQHIKGKRIAYTGRGEFYPLFGKGLVNDVFYVSVNAQPPLAHYYPDGRFRRQQIESAWLENLRREKVDFLVVYLPHEENVFPVEDDWARKNADKFQLAFKNDKVRIYEVSVR